MTYILLVFVGVVAVLVAGFVTCRLIWATSDQRRRWLASGMFYAASLSPIVVTLLSPRLGTGSGFTEFSDAPQGLGVSLIIRAVGYFFLVAVPLLILIRLKSSLVLPGAALLLLAYSGIGLVSSLLNDQPVSIDLFYAALVVTGVLSASNVTLAQAVSMSRISLRVYVWLSLALAVLAPGLVFWDGQGRTWLGLSQLAGVTPHPNGMGTVAALGIMVELIRLEGSKRGKPWHIVAATLVLLAAQSRGAWLSAVIGLIIYLVFRSGARLLITLAPVLLATVLAASTLIEGVANAMSQWSAGGDISTLNGRTTIWSAALEAVTRSPVFGVGPKSFDLEYRADVLGLGGLISSSNAHNQVVQTLVERGVLGLLILLVLVAVLFRNAVQGGGPARAGLVAVLAVFVSRFAVETPLYISTVSLNGAMVIVVVVLIASARNESRSQAAIHRAFRRSGYSLPESVRLTRA